MTYQVLKTTVKIGIAAALAIILFQVSSLYLVNQYFKYEYYLTGVSMLFLIVGFVVATYHPPERKELKETVNPLLNLTNKEVTILKLISECKSNKEIAAISFVEISTVKTHINNIYNKLGISTRKEAVEVLRQSFTILSN